MFYSQLGYFNYIHHIYFIYIYICKTNKSRSDDWADPVEETLLFLHGERTFHSSLGNCRWDSKSERPSVRLSVLAKKYVVDRSEKIHAWETKFVTGTRSLTASQPRRRLSKFKVQRCPEATLPWQRRCLALLFLFVFFLVVLCFAWLFQSGLLAFIRFASGSVSRVSLIRRRSPPLGLGVGLFVPFPSVAPSGPGSTTHSGL